jgi:hypothetical protein
MGAKVRIMRNYSTYLEALKSYELRAMSFELSSGNRQVKCNII